jgi:chemotaxis-related protein WspD
MKHLTINDCWNKIGIWGDEQPRCPELNKLTHCYNCSVYSNAGRKLLDREQDKEYINEWTNNLSKPRIEVSEDLKSALAFRLGNEWFALPSKIIREITQCDKHHSLPHRKNQVLRGLVNVRGELLLCVSLGYLFNLNKKEIDIKTQTTIHERYIVISDDGDYYAFPVSEVKDTLKYDASNLQKTPSTINDGSSNYIEGIIEYQDFHVGLLDIDLIFSALNRNIS